MPATIVVDALWGDSGKGKIAAYIARKRRAAFSVRAGTGTNAGHSIHFENGSEIRTHQLPFIGELEDRTDVPVTLVETGKCFEDIVDLSAEG